MWNARGSQIETKFSDTLTEKLIDIGYHKLFISEKGSQSAKFTVVFEAGAGGGSQDWTKVMLEWQLGKTTFKKSSRLNNLGHRW